MSLTLLVKQLRYILAVYVHILRQHASFYVYFAIPFYMKKECTYYMSKNYLGTGKTTFIRMLAGKLPPEDGGVCI